MRPSTTDPRHLAEVLSARQPNAACAQRGTLRLSQLHPGDNATITGYDCEPTSVVGRRLFDLGFVPGARVELVRRAPLRDPLMVRVADSDMLLRSHEARRICVAVAEDAK